MKNQIKIESPIKPFKKQIEVSSDKSLSIRCLLLSSIALGKSKIYNLLESEDVTSCLQSVKRLGVSFKKKKNYYEINGLGLGSFECNKKNLTINAGNSGTFARLILGLLVDTNKQIKIIGDKSLSKRDFSRVSNPLSLFGANIITNNKKLPVRINGSTFLRPIKYFEKLGSAQCKSAVMLAALKTHGLTKIKAKKSRDHTELLLKYLRVPIKVKKNKSYDLIKIKKINQINHLNYKIPGDLSSCAFFIVLTVLSEKSKLFIKNINVNPTRIGLIKILKKMGASINILNRKIYKGEIVADIFVKSSKNLKGINCPANLNSSAIDEFLVIFLIAAKSKGVSFFKNLSELNEKESPRLKWGSKILSNIGIKNTVTKNSIKIFGNPKVKINKKIKIKGFLKDHRVFMMSVIAALTFGGKWEINDLDSIKTSFPSFLKTLNSIKL